MSGLTANGDDERWQKMENTWTLHWTRRPQPRRRRSRNHRKVQSSKDKWATYGIVKSVDRFVDVIMGYQLWKTSWEKVALEILHVALVTASQIEAKVVASKLIWWYMLIKWASPQPGRVLPRCQRSSSGEMRCKQIHDFCSTFRDVH